MVTRNRESKPVRRLLLAALIGVAAIAVLPSIVDSVAGEQERYRAAEAVRAGHACNICGVVEQVHEVMPAVPRHGISTVAGGGIEGIAVLLGALSGRMSIGPKTAYQVAVRMRDGSVRVLQSSVPPSWKPGDRVKVRMGRIERLS